MNLSIGENMKQLKFPNKLYKVIYADPPWKYSSRKYQDNGRIFLKLEKQYNTMKIQDIMKLPVNQISDEDCACFLWVTDSHLNEGMQVLSAWGFRYVTIAFVWVKKTSQGNTCVNYAPWTLKSTEICILGIKGSMTKYKVNNKVRALVESPRTIHSKKPNEVRNRIADLFGDVPKIELFAREKVNGWDCWGNQAP